MDLRIRMTEAEIAQEAGDIFCRCVTQKPNAALGLATGATPLALYAYLQQEYQRGIVSFREVQTFNLDEYCDLPKYHRNSYFTYMSENLFSQIDVQDHNIHFLDGNTTDVAAEANAYAQAIVDAGGIDIQLLGIGRNGHIGFNEPADHFTDGVFRTKLSESTLEANRIYFSDIAMPRYALTMGIKDILQARQIILIATGEKKAEAVRAMVKGPVTPQCPASVLQQHADVIVFLDEAAASLLS